MPGPIPKTPLSQGLTDFYRVMSEHGLSVAGAFQRHVRPKRVLPPQTHYTEVDVHGGVSQVKNPFGRGFFMAGPEDFNWSSNGQSARPIGPESSWDNLAKALTGVDNPGLVRVAREYDSSETRTAPAKASDDSHPIRQILHAQRLLRLLPTKNTHHDTLLPRPAYDQNHLCVALSCAGFTDSIHEVGPDVFAAFVGVLLNAGMVPNDKQMKDAIVKRLSDQIRAGRDPAAPTARTLLLQHRIITEHTDECIILALETELNYLAAGEADETQFPLMRPAPPAKRQDLPAREAIQQTLDELLSLAPAEITRTRARELLLSRFSRLELLSPNEQENFINNALGVSVNDGVVRIDTKMLTHLWRDLQNDAPPQAVLVWSPSPPETALAVSEKTQNGTLFARASRSWRRFKEDLIALLWPTQPAEPQRLEAPAPQLMDLPVTTTPQIIDVQVAPAAEPIQIPQEEQVLYRRVVHAYRVKHGEFDFAALEIYLKERRPLQELRDANEAIFKGDLELAGKTGDYTLLVDAIMEYLQDDETIPQIISPLADQATRLDSWDARRKPKRP